MSVTKIITGSGKCPKTGHTERLERGWFGLFGVLVFFIYSFIFFGPDRLSE
jgi:2-hydroxychromene-2-carboxylate isomerase